MPSRQAAALRPDRPGLRIWFRLGAAVLVGATLAGGPCGAAGKRSAPEALATTADSLRIVAGAQVDRARQWAAPEEMAPLKPLLGHGPGAAVLLSGLIAESSQYVRVTGDSGLVGWWNPFDDAFLVSRWRRTAAGWRLVGLDALLDADLDPASSATSPAPFDWPLQAHGLTKALQINNRRAIRRFESADPDRLQALLADRPRVARAWFVIGARQAIVRDMLQRAASLPGASAYGETARAALSSPDTARMIDPADGRRLAGLPAATRRSLRPVMVGQTDVGLVVLMQSPLSPAFVVAADLARTTPGGALAPVRLETVSLMQEGLK